MKQATRPTEITQAAVYRCKSKATGEVFYTIKSDSQAVWHTVSFNHHLTAWQCDGEKCQYQARGTDCKHARAVNEVLCVRRARIAEKIGGDMPAIVRDAQVRDDRRRESLLHNNVREFSLMK